MALLKLMSFATDSLEKKTPNFAFSTEFQDSATGIQNSCPSVFFFFPVEVCYCK